MHNGKVASLVAEKGFGFIKPDDGGEDLFFHRSAVVGDFASLAVGQEVTYEVDPSAKKPRAKSVATSTSPAQRSSARVHQASSRASAPRRDQRSTKSRLYQDVKYEFGFVTKLHRKEQRGFISANTGGPELVFNARSVSGEKPYSRLAVGDYVQFVRSAESVAEEAPIASMVQVTERKIRHPDLGLPRNPRARGKKPTWR